MRLIETIGRRTLEAERQLEELAFKTVVPRVAAFLRREARGGMLDGRSHQDIAERLGIHRETAADALNELKAAGIIEIGRRRAATPSDARTRLMAAHERFETGCRAVAARGLSMNTPMFGAVAVKDFVRFMELHTRHHNRQIA